MRLYAYLYSDPSPKLLVLVVHFFTASSQQLPVMQIQLFSKFLCSQRISSLVSSQGVTTAITAAADCSTAVC
jgi:hypothetical protein